MELRVEELQLPQEIRFNYEELRKELSEKVKLYETLVYSDDQIKSAKADRADLNRLKKALNDERIRREKEYMKPFNEFKAQINEIIGIIDKPVSLIDKQIKSYEEEKKRKRADDIERYWDSLDVPAWLKFGNIYDSKWLNSSVSMKSVQEQIDTRIAAVNSDLETLSNLPEFAFEAIETYKASLDMNRAIAEGHRLSEMQKRKAEQEKVRAEQEKARAEQERLRKEQKEQNQAQLRQEYEEEVIKQEEIARQHPNRPITAVKPDPEMKQWVSFSALLDTEDARALAEFFKSRNIEFKRI